MEEKLIEMPLDETLEVVGNYKNKITDWISNLILNEKLLITTSFIIEMENVCDLVKENISNINNQFFSNDIKMIYLIPNLKGNGVKIGIKLKKNIMAFKIEKNLFNIKSNIEFSISALDYYKRDGVIQIDYVIKGSGIVGLPLRSKILTKLILENLVLKNIEGIKINRDSLNVKISEFTPEQLKKMSIENIELKDSKFYISISATDKSIISLFRKSH